MYILIVLVRIKIVILSKKIDTTFSLCIEFFYYSRNRTLSTFVKMLDLSIISFPPSRSIVCYNNYIDLPTPSAPPPPHLLSVCLPSALPAVFCHPPSTTISCEFNNLLSFIRNSTFSNCGKPAIQYVRLTGKEISFVCN